MLLVVGLSDLVLYLQIHSYVQEEPVKTPVVPFEFAISVKQEMDDVMVGDGKAGFFFLSPDGRPTKRDVGNESKKLVKGGAGRGGGADTNAALYNPVSVGAYSFNSLPEEKIRLSQFISVLITPNILKV